MLKLLVDPWLVDVQPEDSLLVRYERLQAIDKLLNLVRDTPADWVKFLTEDFIQVFTNNYVNFQRPDGPLIYSLIKLLSPYHPLVEDPAVLCQTQIPNLPDTWRRALCHCAASDEAPKWRYPMVMVPEIRNAEWPPGNVLKFNAGESARIRNLVRIERYMDHIYFQPDLDPWRLNACGDPTTEERDCDARRDTWKRLPRPPELPPNLTFDQLQVALQGHVASTNGEGTEMYFVPDPIRWNPKEHPRDRWRNCSVFNREQVQEGQRAGRRGYLDRDGRIWIWHNEESHWDVQIVNVKPHEKVSHTGLIL